MSSKTLLFVTAAGIVAAGVSPAPVVAQACSPAASVQYEVAFDATWSVQTHPQDFPASNPHFSGLVGGTHDAGVSFWGPGVLASEGIERMAETGQTGPLIDEVEAAIAQGHALDVVSGGGIGTSPGSVSTTLELSLDYPLATVVSMIAPSPDWFVGVSGVALLIDGNWAGELVVDLYPYDAGTDSGTTYTSPNADTNPAEAIFRIEGYPFVNGETVLPLGTFTFRATSALCGDTDADTLADDADNCIHVANADQRDTNLDGIGNACDADITNDCVVSFLDLGTMKSLFFMPDEDADLSGDGIVNFLDLGMLKDQIFDDFTVDNPSGIPNICRVD